MATFKKKKLVNHNKTLCTSGHKAFDRQTSCISVENVIGSTQTLSYVRPWHETETGDGEHFSEGVLRCAERMEDFVKNGAPLEERKN